MKISFANKFFIINLILVFLILLMSVFANTTNTDIDVTSTKLVSYSTFQYPYRGLEMYYGPEKTYYLKTTYNGENNEIAFVEVLRQADNYIIYRLFADGHEETFLPAPKLSQQQIEDFYDKFDPIKVQARIRREEEEYKKLGDKERQQNKEKMIKEKTLFITTGRGYEISLYLRPSNNIIFEIRNLGAWKYFGFNDIDENTFTYDVSNSINKISSRLNRTLLKKVVRVFVLPYSCKSAPNGIFYENQEEFIIILFNNEPPIDKQFENLLSESPWLELNQ